MSSWLSPARIPAPCGLEPGLAVFEVASVAVGARSGLAVHRAVPRPLRQVRRDAAGLHDPTNRQAAPDHRQVAIVVLARDHGGAQRDGFVGGHQRF